jgi:hypothetical protein
MHGYLVSIQHEAIWPTPPKTERAYVLCECEGQALMLVKASLRLGDQLTAIVRPLADGEGKALGLSRHQVARECDTLYSPRRRSVLD